MNVQFNFLFDRKKKCISPGDKAVIVVRAYQNPKQIFFSTKIFVAKNEWNEKTQRVNNRHPDAESLNARLRQIMSDLEQQQTNNFVRKKVFSLDDVKAYFTNKPEETSSYITFVENELLKDLSLSDKTKVQHRNTLLKLRNFKGKDVLFTDLSYSFIQDFLHHLRASGLKQNTIHKNLKNIKKFVALAIKRGAMEGKDPCEDLKEKTEQNARDVLTVTQLQKVEALIFEEHENKLEQVRDMFLFACYTGLRISDVCGLLLSHVFETPQGLALDLITLKAKKRAKLPLYRLFSDSGKTRSRPENIVSKYRGIHPSHLFLPISEQYVNRQLKIIAFRAELDFNLTFHIGRETFGTYMAGKIPLPVLKDLLQHSEIKTTMRYVHMADQMINDHLSKVEWY